MDMSEKDQISAVDDIIRNVGTSPTFSFENTYKRMQEQAPWMDRQLKSIETKKRKYKVNNYILLSQETRKRHNELVLTHTGHVVRLIGFYDGEDDYYYIVKNTNGVEPRHSYWSCVGGLVYLKDRLEQDEYESLDRTCEYAGCEKAEAYMFKTWKAQVGRPASGAAAG